MAASGAEQIGRRDDAWAFEPSAVDRFLQPHVIEIGRADVADGREPGIESLLGIRGADRRPKAVGVFEGLVAADFGKAVHVHVHVDKAGDQGLTGQVEALDPCRKLHRSVVSNLLNSPVVADEDRGAVDVTAGLDVEHPVGGDDGRGRRGRGNGQDRHRSQQNVFRQRIPPQMWITRPNAARTLSCIISDRVGCGKTVWMKSSSTNSAVLPIV
jgi:hypothetical protein